jgi:hypothetical protein
MTVSGCFHYSDPGATPGQRLITVFALADVSDGSDLLLSVSCAVAKLIRTAAMNPSMMKVFQ